MSIEPTMRPIVSADQQWWWDGTQWLPNVAPSAVQARAENTLALGAGITGLVSLFGLIVPFFWFLAVPGSLTALIMGGVAWGRPGRRGWAVTGVIAGAVGLILGGLMYLYVADLFMDLSDSLDS